MMRLTRTLPARLHILAPPLAMPPESIPFSSEHTGAAHDAQT